MNLCSYQSIVTHLRCMKKCFMMEPKQKATWAEIDVGALVTPDFVKACIRWVNTEMNLTPLLSLHLRCMTCRGILPYHDFSVLSILLQGGNVLYEAWGLSVGKVNSITYVIFFFYTFT